MTVPSKVVPLAVLLSVFGVCCGARAEKGDPLAIRMDGKGVLMENFWGLGVLVHSGDSGPISDSTHAVGFQDKMDHVWQRPVFIESTSWEKRSDENSDPNQFAVSSEGSGTVIVDVDGVRLVVLSADADSFSKTPDLSGSVAILVVLGKRTMKQASSIIDAAESLPFAAALWEEGSQLPGSVDAKSQPHNLFAASTSMPSGDTTRHFVLSASELTLRDEVADLFTKMNRANEDSQKVFRPLSSTQLNFRPSNGTHTPRWNSEHMMGRQLFFFSQIYHELDETIPVMNLNPKQMPKDYEAAKPDWNGFEEAEQMARVDAYCARFSYLLKDVPLDQRAPGSRWTLRGLLRQMERHYDQHTANTVAKFSLPEWPATKK
ncbi:MAG: DinB family protein [Planctomycetota bacterium]